jgi:D-sedoheptulose 7-phosphate isomerase
MKRIIETNFNEHIKVTNKTMKKLKNKISLISLEIKDCLNRNGKIIWCGNGGSAADSLHLSSEFLGKFKNKRKPLASISLSSDISNITCISNDFGYENVFSRQLEGLGKEKDLLICLTTSGNSKNIIKCLQMAKKLSIKSILFSGKNGGKAKYFSDINLVIPSSSTARIQEMHTLIGQTICDITEKLLKIK